MADIGGGTTDISVFKDSSIWLTAVIPVAGYQVTKDLAIGLGLPFEVAEEMKKKYGTALPVYEGKQITIPLRRMATIYHIKGYVTLSVLVWMNS